MIDEMSDACYTMDNNQHCEVRMKNKQPPFQITNKIIDDVAEISELTGRLSAHDLLSSNPNLRRTNRIRTIHGSLAIEQNTLEAVGEKVRHSDGIACCKRVAAQRLCDDEPVEVLLRSKMPMRFTSGWTSLTPTPWTTC